MVTSRLFVVLFIVVFKMANCVSVGKGDRDVKFKLLSLLTPTYDLPQVLEDPSIDIRNNFIKIPSYLPTYKSRQNFLYTEPQKGGFKNGKFAIPWLNSQDEELSENKGDSIGFNKNSASLKKIENGFDRLRLTNKKNWYEVNEQRGEHKNKNYPPLVRPTQTYPQLYPGHNYGFRPVPGSYQGSGLHYHHNHDFHSEHGPDSFGYQRRRPRPSPPPRTGAPVNIDPTVSTLAGIISTEAPDIDIRFGRDTRDREDTITFSQ